MSKLKNIYNAAVSKLGADLPLSLARSFGAVDGIDDVPADRRDGLVAALSRVMAGGQMSAAMAEAAAHGEGSPLQKAFRDARRVAGKAAVHRVLVAHGAAGGVLEDVPAARRGSCLMALQKLAASDDGDETDAFAGIRAKAYGERQTPPTTIDADAIYARWNASVRPNEDE
jgi:hypothetical protein